MKHLGIAMLFLVLLLSCNETRQGEPQEGSQQDSSQKAVTREPMSTGKETFSQRYERYSKVLFSADYKTKKMDPMDRFPQFKTAPQSKFSRYQMAKPISNTSGKSIFPRLTAKAYRFPSPQVALETVRAWLQGFESSADSVVLGEDIEYVKSPPLFAAVWQNEFYIVQTACIYQHATYDDLRQSFNEFWEKEEATYVLEIDCNGGGLHYSRKQP